MRKMAICKTDEMGQFFIDVDSKTGTDESGAALTILCAFLRKQRCTTQCAACEMTSMRTSQEVKCRRGGFTIGNLFEDE